MLYSIKSLTSLKSFFGFLHIRAVDIDFELRISKTTQKLILQPKKLLSRYYIDTRMFVLVNVIFLDFYIFCDQFCRKI